jgi:hypothetical protein
VGRPEPGSAREIQDRLEHGREITGVRVDYLQHPGRRGLLLQRLALFGAQPRVFNRDDRLIGEAPEQPQLILGEGAHICSVKHHHTDQRIFLAESDLYGAARVPTSAKALREGTPDL